MAAVFLCLLQALGSAGEVAPTPSVSLKPKFEAASSLLSEASRLTEKLLAGQERQRRLSAALRSEVDLLQVSLTKSRDELTRTQTALSASEQSLGDSVESLRQSMATLGRLRSEHRAAVVKAGLLWGLVGLVVGGGVVLLVGAAG